MIYDEQGNITRFGAEQVIREGGSVSLKGKIYSTIESLPDEATFAAGSPEAQAGARERLQTQIADAQAQLTRLGNPPAGGGVSEVGAAKGDEDAGPNAPSHRRSGKS